MPSYMTNAVKSQFKNSTKLLAIIFTNNQFLGIN